MYNKKLYCLHEANLPMEIKMHPDGRLEFVGYETFGGVLDYPVSAHPVRDGDDLLFHSYSVDEEVSVRYIPAVQDPTFPIILIVAFFFSL